MGVVLMLVLGWSRCGQDVGVGSRHGRSREVGS
jgi:hypothetical protein